MSRIEHPELKYTPQKFIVKVSNYNRHISPKLYLLCGDPSLETIIKEVDEYRNNLDLFDYVNHNEVRYWKEGTLLLRDFAQMSTFHPGIFVFDG